MKKMFSLALALIMALALAVPAMAASDTKSEKTITIENSAEGETYKAYKVFDLTKTSENEDAGYAYTINEGAMFNLVVGYIADADGVAPYTGNGLTLTKSTEAGKWNVEHSGFNAVAFAQYLNGKDFAGVELAGSVTATGKGATITVTGAGYYFVDSTLGALCALDTANAVTVYEKNSIPTITKWVDEDDTDADEALFNDEWQKSADADYGQEVDFLLVVNTGTTNTNDADQTNSGVDAVYTIVDTIPAYLHFNNDIVIKKNNDDTAEVKYEVTDVVEDETGTVVTIKLDATGDPENTDYYIYYSVKVGTVEANKPHTNTAVLTYKAQRSESSATVYTWDLPIYKYTMDGTEKAALANAKFTLHKVNADGKAVYAVAEKVDTVYNFNSWTTDAEAATVFESPEDGEFIVRGLDSDTYILTETEAPAGYNALTEPVEIELVAEKESDGNYTGGYDIEVDDTVVTRVEIENKTGVELPSTGGMGTTLFYIVGGVMAAGAAILLVTKKKLANQE